MTELVDYVCWRGTGFFYESTSDSTDQLSKIMAARDDDIAANEMDDQTGQNSAKQVSNSESKVHTFSTEFKIQNVFKIKRNFPDTPILNALNG